MIEELEHRWRPISAGIAVPVFAFFAAGVTVIGGPGLAALATDPIAVGIVVGLVVGKPLGILGATWLVATLTRAKLDESLAWGDMLGLSMVAGIGFTVSLLVGELAFGETDHIDVVKIAVLVSSLASALLAAVVLRRRNTAYRLIAEAEANGDGSPSD